MSRRRPARSGKHLERDQAVAEQVAQASRPSMGPCPGPCNRGFRKQVDRRAAAVDRVRGDLVRHLGPVADEMLEQAALVVAEAEVPLPTPRRGDPVWCRGCTSDVQVAVESFPQLLEWMLDRVVGDVLERVLVDDTGARVEVLGAPTVPVRVLEVVPDRGGLAERLACGHYRHRVGIGPWPAKRVCTTCVASAIVPEPGRLAPGAKAARSAAGRPGVSPAGSPAWVELDDAVTWLCSVGEAARVAIGLDVETYEGRTGSTAARVAEATRAAHHLQVRLEQLLASPLAESFGRAAVRTAQRLLRLSGMDDLVHRLEGECPVCGRRSLERANGADRVRCSTCWASWAEDYYQHLVRIQVWEAQHPDMAPEEQTDEDQQQSREKRSA